MPNDNETKGKGPDMHLTGGLCMKARSSPAAVDRLYVKNVFCG